MGRGGADPRRVAGAHAAQLPELRGEQLGTERSERTDRKGRTALADSLISLRVVDDGAALARAAAEELARLAGDSVRAHGRFTVALSGGSTPRALFALLADPGGPYRDRIDWSALHVFWGDERHVPPDHPDSNYRMAREALLDHVPVPAANIHRILAEDPDAAHAAAQYDGVLAAEFALAAPQLPRFDLVLLGLGP